MKHIAITPLEEVAPLFVLLDVCTKDMVEEAFSLGEVEFMYNMAEEKARSLLCIKWNWKHRIQEWSRVPLLSVFGQMIFETDCMAYFLLGCPK